MAGGQALPRTSAPLTRPTTRTTRPHSAGPGASSPDTRPHARRDAAGDQDRRPTVPRGPCLAGGSLTSSGKAAIAQRQVPGAGTSPRILCVSPRTGTKAMSGKMWNKPARGGRPGEGHGCADGDGDGDGDSPAPGPRREPAQLLVVAFICQGHLGSDEQDPPTGRGT